MLTGNSVDVGQQVDIPFLQHHSLSLTSSALDHSTTSIYRKNNYPTDLTALYIMSYEFYFKKLRNTLNLEKVSR
jgi:hypothetical protein